MEPMKAAVTNQQIATDLGVSHTMVSRIRSGDRVPSIDLMMVIEKTWGWPIAQQANARAVNRYADIFEARVENHYAERKPDPFHPAKASNYGVG